MAMTSEFFKEPPFNPDAPDRTGVLLCNLGTPDEPTPAAVRRYLAQFLSDRRVVEIPRLVWALILHGVILRVRPAKSAAKYATIWTPEGSPLRLWTQKQATMLRGFLGEQGYNVLVRPAMRYGTPSIEEQLTALKAEGATRVLVITAYPQYSGTTTASVFDAVYAWAARTRALPEFRFVNRYHDHPGYIQALAKRVRAYWQTNGRGDNLVMSFHGVPERTVKLGDPYQRECQQTAQLLAQALGLQPDQWTLTFQSRFGKAKWLEPYTEPTLVALGGAGVARVDVVCPGFTCDCLETLEEIAQEAREAFLHAGGKEFHYISCLNDSHEWIAALCAIAQQQMQGWPQMPVSSNTNTPQDRAG